MHLKMQTCCTTCSTCIGAAVKGHIECLKHLHENHRWDKLIGQRQYMDILRA